MNIVKDENESKLKLTLSGSSDPVGNKNFAETVDVINNNMNIDIEIDLSKLEYMDSTSIGIMLRLYKTQKQKNHGFRILNASEKVSSLLTLCSLSDSLVK